MVYLQCKNCVIHERFSGEVLTMGRYTNLRTFTFFAFSCNCGFHFEVLRMSDLYIIVYVLF